MKRYEIKTLTQIMTEKPTKLSKAELCTFIGALISGLAAHLFQYANKMYNYDDLFVNPGGFGTGVESGRWFLQIMGEWVNKYFGNYSLPMFNGFFTLVLLAISATMLVRLFEVKDLLLATFVGMLFVTTPSVVCMNFYMFTALYYAVAIFLSFLSGYLIVRHGKNILIQVIAVLLLACAVGTYQAYFTNTLCILVLDIIVKSAFSRDDMSGKEIFSRSVRYVVELALGIGVYFLFTQFSLKYWNVTLGSYQGINNMGHLELHKLPQLLYNCYHCFLWFPIVDIFWENPTTIVKRAIKVMYVITILLVIAMIIRKRRDCKKLMLMLLSMLTFPIAVFFIYIMVQVEGYIYPLMTFSVIFIYVFVFVWLDKYMKENVTWKFEKEVEKIMHWCISIAAIVITVVYIWNANGNYMSLWYTQQHDIAYFQTMLTQIRSAEGYRSGLPLAVIGREAEIEDSEHTTGSLMGAEFDIPGKSESNINGYSRWHILIQYLGYNPEFLFDDKTSEIAKWDEVRAMPCYPEDGAIKIVDDIIVLKLSDEVK